jgi:hypothetical protein
MTTGLQMSCRPRGPIPRGPLLIGRGSPPDRVETLKSVSIHRLHLIGLVR